MRRYPPETIERVRFVREAQQLGFTLREVRDLLALRADPASDCADVRERAAAKLDEVLCKIEKLQRIGVALQSLVDSCPKHGSLDTCTILEALAAPARPCDGICGAGLTAPGRA